MKNAVKKLALAVATSFVVAGSAHAVPQVFGGIKWDPNLGIDFKVDAAAVQGGVGDADANGRADLQGVGKVTFINNTAASTFCQVATCELTFQYGGFEENAIGSMGVDPIVTGLLRGGWVKFYRQDVGNAGVGASALTVANTGDGVLWLELAGHIRQGALVTGNFSQSFDDIGGPASFSAQIALSVVSGAALADVEAEIDTNSITAPNLTKYDLKFSPTFVSFPGASFGYMEGVATFSGDSLNNVPEPASAALAGLALLGLGAARRRRAAK